MALAEPVTGLQSEIAGNNSYKGGLGGRKGMWGVWGGKGRKVKWVILEEELVAAEEWRVFAYSVCAGVSAIGKMIHPNTADTAAVPAAR